MASRLVNRWACVALAIGSFAFAGVAAAGDDESVVSAFLLNLAKYVEWPEASFDGADAPFVIGVIGDAKFAEVLTGNLAGKRVRKRSLEVRMVTNVAEARGVHLLYAGRRQRGEARDLAGQMKGEPVLSVADYDRFTHVGGMIAIDIKRGKISFEISRSEADRGGLKVSSKLLRLASAVR